MLLSPKVLLACVRAMSAEERQSLWCLLLPRQSVRDLFGGVTNAVPQLDLLVSDAEPIEDRQDCGAG